GDGGGLVHMGFSKNGQIAHNSILFNQSTNPTIPTNGGGIIIMGAPDVDPPCGATTDADCVPPLGSVGPSDGAGPGLVIDANLILGNAAESGSGGGLRLQHVNGGDVVSFPLNPEQWYSVNVTNNIIANNVAGWDGGGVSLLDTLAANIVNNTLISNDTTASSGVLFNTLGAPLASSQGPCPPGQIDPATGLCRVQVTTSTPQPAGLVSIQNSATLVANLPATITCPAGHYAGTTASNGTCRQYSYPVLTNDVFWQNRVFNITVGSFGPGTLNQQHVVTLVPTLNQTATGSCQTGASYWDIGVRGDTGPGNHGSGITLNPTYSVLTSTSGYGSTNMSSNPAVAAQYCNGSRVPPEFKSGGFQVPPGISDATVPNPVFNLTPAATVDEGNNWINISWGPLALTNPVTGVVLGNYTPNAGAPTTNAGTAASAYTTTDFFGTTRPQGGGWDIGAVEFSAATATHGPSANLTPLLWSPSAVRGVTLLGPVQIFTLTNTGTVPLAGITQATLGGANAADYFIVRLLSTCGPAGGGQLLGQTSLAPGAACVVTVQFRPRTTDLIHTVTPATLQVRDSAGTQTSVLNGTAN
ncbi:MAG TPA: choice-of-anchor Q domain-containing protein, partial [Terriglobales bacterium]|nr:choice-of-anchor Q domain-containing protein [Terriglobales bacterium]